MSKEKQIFNFNEVAEHYVLDLARKRRTEFRDEFNNLLEKYSVPLDVYYFGLTYLDKCAPPDFVKTETGPYWLIHLEKILVESISKELMEKLTKLELPKDDSK